MPSVVETAEEGDATYFVYRELRGDFDFAVEMIEDPAPRGADVPLTYGVMARRDAAPMAKSNYIHLLTDQGVGEWGCGSFGTADGGPGPLEDTQGAAGDAPDSLPSFLRMARRGETFYRYVSDDGVRWSPVGTDAWHGILANPVLVGFTASFPDGPGGNQPPVRFRVIHLGPTDSTVTESIHDDATMDGELVFEALFDDDDGADPDGFRAQAGSGEFTPEIRDRRLRLSDEAFPASSTSAFSEFVIDDIDSAIYQFDFDVRFRNDGATDPGHGLTCALVAGDETQWVGSSGIGLGYEGLSPGADPWKLAHNSVGVEIEMNEIDPEAEPASPSYHVGIDVQGRVESVRETGSAAVLPDIFSADGAHARVFYNRGHLEVYLGANGEELQKVLGAALLPVSFGAASEQAVFGFTASTGDDAVTAEVDNLAVTRIVCDDIPEVAVITGAPKDGASIGNRVFLDGSASNGGPGDESEPVSLRWRVVSGPAEIDGPDFGRTAIVAVSGEERIVVELVADDGRCDNPAATRVSFSGTSTNIQPFLRADANSDGAVDLSDAVVTLNWLFLEGREPSCPAAADSVGVGEVNLMRVVYTLSFLFRNGSPPAPPYPTCGSSVLSSDAELGCERSFPCE